MQKKTSAPVVAMLILAILVGLGCAWVLLVDRSPSSCIARGNAAMNAENYSIAARLYERAVRSGADDPEVSVKLAEAYRRQQNYTKAEYVLVGAISRHSDLTELYVALSRTYVEQGKFLDAAQLIERAVNDQVRAELEAMRPAAPHLSPQEGFYSELIEVEALCAAGHLYLSDDGDYPASLSQAYEKPYALPRGETTLCAIAADDRGLVSPLTKGTYTVSGIVEEITIADPALDALLREALGAEPDAVLMTSDLWTIESLTVPAQVQELSQLSACVGLKSLTLESGASSTLDFLSRMPQLEELVLSGRTVSAENLQNIALTPSLRRLDLSRCALRDIGVLSALTELEELDLSDNTVSDPDAIASMTKLKVLKLHNNPITSISALRGCTELKELDVSSCELINLNAIADRPALEKLDASDNRLSTTEALRGCTGLLKLDLSENQLVSFDELAGLEKLEELDLSYNQLTELPQLDLNRSMLRSIKLEKNKIRSLAFLRDLIYLNYIYADSNEISDLTPVAGCYNLVSVSVWDNPVNEDTVPPLKEHSIQVHYEPKR